MGGSDHEHPRREETGGGGAWLADGRVATLLLLAASLLWGSAFWGIKRGYRLLGLTPGRGAVRGALIFAGVRFFAAGLALSLVSRLSRAARGGPAPRRGPTARLALLGLLQTGLHYALFYLGVAHTSGVKAAVLVAAGSLFLALASPLAFADDRLDGPRVGGLLLGFGGVVLASSTRGSGAPGIEWLGDLLMLGAALVSAAATVVGKRLLVEDGGRLGPVALNGTQLLWGGAMLLVAALPWGPVAMPPLSAELVALTAYLTFVTAVAFSLYYLVVKHHRLTRVASYRFLIPICGAVESALLIAGERLGPELLASVALVAAGIWLVNRPTGR